MNGFISPFQSLGLAAAAATAIVGVGQLLGYAVEPAAAKDLSEAVFGAVTIVTGIVAAVGRIRASKKIKL